MIPIGDDEEMGKHKNINIDNGDQMGGYTAMYTSNRIRRRKECSQTGYQHPGRKRGVAPAIFEMIDDTIIKSSIDMLAEREGFSKSDAAMFKAAYNEAKYGDMNEYHLGCVLAYKGEIIGAGYNTTKTCPMQKRYNIMYRAFVPFTNSHKHEHSTHAEIAALRSVSASRASSIQWQHVKAYVYRISPGLPHFQGNAFPCPACVHALFDAGIRHVYSSNEYGFTHTVLDDNMIMCDKAMIRQNLMRLDALDSR